MSMFYHPKHRYESIERWPAEARMMAEYLHNRIMEGVEKRRAEGYFPLAEAVEQDA